MSMEFHRSYTRENGLWKRSVLYILNWDTPSLKYLTITVTLDIRKTSGLAWRFFVGCNVVNPIRNHSQWLTISVDRLSNHTISGSSGKTWQYLTSGDFPWFPMVSHYGYHRDIPMISPHPRKPPRSYAPRRKLSNASSAWAFQHWPPPKIPAGRLEITRRGAFCPFTSRNLPILIYLFITYLLIYTYLPRKNRGAGLVYDLFSCSYWLVFMRESSTNKPTSGERTSMGGTDLKITQGHPMSHLIYTLEHVWMKWFGVSASWTEKHILNFTSRPSLSFGKTDLHRIYDGPTQMPPFRSPRPYCRFTSCHHVYI